VPWKTKYQTQRHRWTIFPKRVRKWNSVHRSGTILYPKEKIEVKPKVDAQVCHRIVTRLKE